MKRSIRIRPTRASTLALLMLTAACGNRDAVTAPVGTGVLAVTLTAPGGITPSVVITGPDGYARTVTSTITLDHLAAGSYTITADSILTPSTLVGYSVDTGAVTGSSVTVGSTGSSSASVTYAFARLEGAMWMANIAGPHVTGLAPSQLESSAIVGAADTVGGAPNSGGVAIDSHGNMWVAQVATATLSMYTVAQRESNATSAPARTLSSPAFSQPGRINFDSHGTLWIADYNNGLIGFSAAQLAAGGAGIQPIAIVSDTTRGFAGPSDIAFDSSGNAWVAEAWTENLVMYTPAMLTTSGSPEPSVRIGSAVANPRIVRDGVSSSLVALGVDPPSTNLQTPLVLAFDVHGKLWVGNYGGAKVTAYSPAQLSTSGDPVPAVTLTGEIAYPVGLAFDRAGNLWMSDDDSYDVLRFDASLLGASATVAASVVLESGDFNGPQQIVFDQWSVASTPPLTQVSRTHLTARGSRRTRGALHH